jgi:UDP-N-acetylmuramoyl-tripeptide--D-alanyl-D-alanine ligase
MRLTINEMLKVMGARLPVGSPNDEVDGAFVDSRAPVDGALFVGLRGEMADGGQFAFDALRRGAAGALISESTWRWVEGDLVPLRKPVIVAADPLAAFQAAARLALERSGARVVAITGSTGKTTTKDILLALLAAAGVAVSGTPGNLNTEVGVPIALMGLEEGTEVAVVEMGMRGPGQIRELTALAPPDVACITAIAPVHIEVLGSLEAVAAAKAEVLEALRPGGVAVVPESEPLLEPHLASLDPSVKVVRVGDGSGINLDLNLNKGWQRRNAAAALAICEALGAAVPAGASVSVALSPMRGQESQLPGGGTLIEDCYNANPVAMEAALADLASRPGRRVAVLGDMLELGPEEARYHRETGAAAASSGVDLLVAVGERAAAYVEGAGALASLHYPTVEEAVEDLPARLEPGDTVLLKASRGMALERIGDRLLGRGV